MSLRKGAAALVLAMVAAASFAAGCTDAGGPDAANADAPAAPGYDGPFPFALDEPVIVWEHSGDATLEYLPRFFEDCRWNARPFDHVKTFDRTGAFREQIENVTVGPDSPPFLIPLHGEGPWLVAGHTHPCTHPTKSVLSGVTNGSLLNRRVEFDLDAAVQNSTVRLQVPIGSLGTTATWTFPALSWGALGAYPYFVSGRAGFFGWIRVYYPDGELWREDRFGISGFDTSYEPIQFMPGAYLIEIDLMTPASESIEIEYRWKHFELNPTICRYGFEWEFCNTT